MACALPGIASGIGIDPTLPRDGTDFITLEVVMRIMFGCDSAALRFSGERIHSTSLHLFNNRRAQPSRASGACYSALIHGNECAWSTGSRLPKELPKQFLGLAGAFLAEADRFVFVLWITNQTTLMQAIQRVPIVTFPSSYKSLLSERSEIK